MGLLDRFTKPTEPKVLEQEEEPEEEEFDEEQDMIEDNKIISEKSKKKEFKEPIKSFRDLLYDLVNTSEEDPRIIYYEVGSLQKTLLESMEQDEE